MKKILLIQPRPPESIWTLKVSCEIAKVSALTAPLGLATLAALTPSQYDVQIVDESVESIDFDIDCDLVGITGYTVHSERMIEISKEFQKRGVLTVAGGAFCSSHPQVAQEHFDVVVKGEAERIWGQFLEDWDSGDFKSFYEEPGKIDLLNDPSPKPRWDLVKSDRYMVHAVQTTRGCPYNCEFCDVVSLFGQKSRHKTVEQVIEEVKDLAKRDVIEIFFADDNFIGNKKYAKSLLRALIELNATLKISLRFITQATLNCAEDEELMDLFKRANFFAMFVGIETPSHESLKSANKQHNMRIDMVQSVRNIQKRGILVVSGMIVGFDTDDIDIFEAQKEFIMKSGLVVPMVGMLMAPKGTRLWDRLEKENRLEGPEVGDSFKSTNIIPKLMSKEVMVKKYLELLEVIYSDDFFRKTFKIMMEQIDVDAIRKESAVANALSPRRAHFRLTMLGLRIVRSYLFSSKTDRKLMFDILSMSIRKSIFCIPLGMSALIFFKSNATFFKTQSYTLEDNSPQPEIAAASVAEATALR